MPDPLAPHASVAATTDPQEAVARVRAAYDGLREQIHKVIVGQDEVVEQILMAMFCRGHALVEGVPGLAKTLLISTIARTLSLGFSRIQFTPDLMPSDITGTEVIEEDKSTGSRELRFVKGPIFANVILADEINRTPPKTQAGCSKRCRSTRSLSAACSTNCPAVHRARDAEPHRAGGHLPAARGPTRPVHVQGPHHLSDGR